MRRKIDFTYTGGYPLTQDDLDLMQIGAQEQIDALAEILGDGTVPVIISGMEVSVGSPNTTVSEGWFWYLGHLIKFEASSFDNTVILGGGDVRLVQIVTATTDRVYNDGSTHPAIIEITAHLTSGASVSDATQFPWSDFDKYASRLSKVSTDVVSDSGSYSGSTSLSIAANWEIDVNRLTKKVVLRATAITSNPAAATYLPDRNIIQLMYLDPTIATIPVQFRFKAYIYSIDGSATDAFLPLDGGGYVSELDCMADPDGTVYVYWVRADLGISDYGIVINAEIPCEPVLVAL